MTSRIKFSVVFSSMLLTLLLVVGAVLGKGEETDDAYRPLAVYTEVLARIKSDYVEEPDITKVTRGALQGLVEHLDPMSSYLDAEQYQEYLQRIAVPDGGSGLSTGMVVQKRGNYSTVLSVLDGSAADRAGVRPGDLIEAIDEVSARVLPPALLKGKLSGEPGSSVRVLLRSSQNYDEPQELQLTRALVKLPEVESRLLDSDIGYLDADALGQEQIEQLAQAVESLVRQGAKKLILDLRETAVGAPEIGVELADLFLTKGVMATVEGQKYAKKTFEADPEQITTLPLAVLVDRPTSGAAEVAAAALLDNGRAEIVGESTFGLAAVQETVEMEDGSALILSVAKFHRPKGEALHDQGLEPNQPVEPAALRRFRDPEQKITPGGPEDPFLKKALDVLSGKVAAAA